VTVPEFRSGNPGITESALWFAVLFGCLFVVGLLINEVTDRREGDVPVPSPLRQVNDGVTWGAAACLVLGFLALIVAAITVAA